MTPARWRAMTPDDIGAVHAIATATYPSLPEPADGMAERQRLCPAGCLVLEAAAGPVGYAIAHPWRLGHPPPLAAMLGALPDRPDTFHVHDVALLPRARGHGHARQALDALARAARSFDIPVLSLVAVAGAAMYWGDRGFAPAPGLCPADRLASYGDGARYMIRAA
jgi:GNAT superfamily N-acetyltransferase